ncbi:MAG: hypothetical protein WDW38_004017 [Sanguina aurantia]
MLRMTRSFCQSMFERTGKCSYGDNCKYSHGQEGGQGAGDANNMQQQQFGGGGSSGMGFMPGLQGGNAGHGEDWERDRDRSNPGARGLDKIALAARKTRLCEKFMSTGSCPYENRCTFAHGFEELRGHEGGPGGAASSRPDFRGERPPPGQVMRNDMPNAGQQQHAGPPGLHRLSQRHPKPRGLAEPPPMRIAWCHPMQAPRRQGSEASPKRSRGGLPHPPGGPPPPFLGPPTASHPGAASSSTHYPPGGVLGSAAAATPTSGGIPKAPASTLGTAPSAAANAGKVREPRVRDGGGGAVRFGSDEQQCVGGACKDLPLAMNDRWTAFDAHRRGEMRACAQAVGACVAMSQGFFDVEQWDAVIEALGASTARKAADECDASHIPFPSALCYEQDVTFVDRVRAICGILNIGNAAALSKEKPAALQAAVVAIRNGSAFRSTPFADDADAYLG